MSASVNPDGETLAESARIAPSTRPARAPKDVSVLEHEYDGIVEYDNPMPRWWVNLFWGSIVFSIAYAVHFHWSGRGPSVVTEYAADVRAANAARAQASLSEAPSEAALGALMADGGSLHEAKLTFEQRCAACHAAEGQGLIGPNLTDEHWLNGDGTLMAIYQVVSQGVPAKGMPAWELQLQPVELRKVVAFVGSMRGKNLPGKPPEGTPKAGP